MFITTAVGAWESALQPPVIVGATTPQTAIEGFLWFNTSDSILYVYRSGAWNAVVLLPASGAEVRVSDTPNAVPSVGDLWWDTVEGQLLSTYTDPDGGSCLYALLPHRVCCWWWCLCEHLCSPNGKSG